MLPAASRKDATHDLIVTPKPADAERFSKAHDHLRRLEQFPTWNPPADAKFLAEMGENLFRLAFPTQEAVREFAQALVNAVREEATLRVWFYAADPQVAMLPWEYLYMPGDALEELARQQVQVVPFQRDGSSIDEYRFLALHPNISLVRQGSPSPPDASLNTIGPLRVLVAWANPCSRTWPVISGIEAEVTAILNDLRGLPKSHVEVRLVGQATRKALEDQMREFRPHVFHFTGHGGFPGAPDDPGDLRAPSLVVEGEDTAQRRRHHYLTAEELRALCAACGTQVVVLNCCWSGHTGGKVTGIAQALAAAPEHPVPVVVGMQLPLPQSAGVGFAGPFYQNVAMARSIEDGVRSFRTDSVRAHPFGCGVPDWGIPVVYMGVRQSALFRAVRVDVYPLNFGELIRQHVPIVGREFLRKRIADFTRGNDRGIFLLTAPPGLGKTAFLAQWVADNPDSVHFFFRATAGITDPDECLKSIYHGLLAKYGTIEQNPTNDPIELRTRLRQWLFPEVSQACQRRNAREIMVIDALDEAGRSHDGMSVVEMLPIDLPPRVYFLLATRQGPVADALLRRPGVTHFYLEPLAYENREDAAGLCMVQLVGRVGQVPLDRFHRVCERLAERAQGNFLVLRHFLSKEILGQHVEIEGLERAAEDLTGAVEQIYELFLERVTRRLEDDPDRLELLYKTLGAFATARAPVTPEQVCAAFGLTLGQWHWSFALVSQFLERGGLRQEEQGALTYRLYHETFREFLLRKLGSELGHFHRRWAEYSLRWRELSGYSRVYALRHLVTHLIQGSKGSIP